MEQLVGQQLKNYQILKNIDKGGFGEVYLARQTNVDREVVVKKILPQHANQPEFIRRFEQEANLVARLEHFHIVPLYDYWRDQDGAYLIMRYMRGGSLKDLMEQTPLSLEDCARLVDQISMALFFAHQNHVIHRDIKPGNILMDEDANAFLADFGIAKDLKKPGDGETSKDAVVGTLDYLSPEQARGEPVTGRSDIYSLAVVVYEILERQHPFHEFSRVERLFKHINDPLPHIEKLEDRIRDDVNDVVQKATEKDPAKRYTNVLEFATELRDSFGLEQQTLSVEASLTKREHEVLQCLADGLSNREIAEKLYIEPGTVKWYNSRIYEKLGVRSRVQAAVKAHDLQLIGQSPDNVSLPSLDFSTSSEPDNPYKGLHAFSPADTRDFFGRAEMVQKLVEKMRHDNSHYRFLSIVGPSGSGKSSLVKAGLIPAIWNGGLPGSENWFVVDMLPGTHPIDTLETALTRVSDKESGSLREQLDRDDRGLIRVADIILPPDNSELLIVVDQFEEVFTLVEDEATRQHFLDLLRIAVSDARSRVRIVVTLRADYYDRPLHYPEFGELVRARMETILPLTAKGLERAVRGPAERVGVTFEQGLVAQIVADMNYQAGALPLLQYSLTELFDHREGRLLTHTAYQEIGGAVGALANRADEIFRSMTDEAQALAHQMFLRLVTLGEGAEDTRRRANFGELLSLTEKTDLMEEVIDSFADYRLLSLDNDPETRQPTIEVAHEAILREWDRLRAWLNESRDDIRQERDLARATTDWDAHNRDSSYLLRGARLEQVEEWKQSTQLTLTPLENYFIETSLLQREADAEEEAQRVEYETKLERSAFNRLRYAVGIFAIATVVSLLLSGVAYSASIRAGNDRDDAQLAADESLSVALAVSAQQAFENDEHDLALALAIEANSLVENPLSEVRRALVDIAYAPGLRAIWRQDSTRMFAFAMSPDSRYVVTGEGGRVIDVEGKIPVVSLWDVATGEEIRFFGNESAGHTGTVFTAVFTPDSHRVITAGVNNEAFLWDVETGEMLQQYQLPEEGYFNRIVISPDGQILLANVCFEGHPALGCTGEWGIVSWDVESGQLSNIYYDNLSNNSQLIPAHDSTGFYTVHRRLIDGEEDEWFDSLIYYDLNSNQEIFLYEPERFIIALTLSPDGQILAAGMNDNQIFLINANTGDTLLRFQAPVINVRVNALEFSHDGQTVISGDENGLFHLWNVATGAEVERFRGHNSPIRHLDFTQDSRQAVSMNNNGDLLFWDILPGNHRLSYQPEDIPGLWNLALLSDGERVVMTTGRPGFAEYVDADTHIILHNIVTGEEIWRTVAHRESIWGLALSPDETMLLTGSRNSAEPTRLWDMTTGELLRQFDMASPIYARGTVAFTPDSQQALIASNGIVHLFDIETGLEIRRFIHGGALWRFELSPDKALLVTSNFSNPGLVKVWNFETAELLRTFYGHTNGVAEASFLTGSNQIISGSFDSSIRIHDIASSEELRLFEGVNPLGQSWVTLNQERDLALFTDLENNVVILDITTGDELAQFPGFSDGTRGAFSYDSQTVFTQGWEGGLHVWDLPPASSADIIAWANENRLVRELTEPECQRFRICEDGIITPAVFPTLVIPPMPTATPVYDVSIAPVAVIGENRGYVEPGKLEEIEGDLVAGVRGGISVWIYEGQSGENLTFTIIADNPTSDNNPTNNMQNGLMDSLVEIYDPAGQFLIQNNNISNENRNSRIENFELPVDGTYRIEVSGAAYYTGGDYTLIIESDREE